MVMTASEMIEEVLERTAFWRRIDRKIPWKPEQNRKHKRVALRCN